MTPRRLAALALLLAACAAGRLPVRLEPEDGRPGPPLVLVLSGPLQVASDLTVLEVTLENRSLAPLSFPEPLRLELLDDERQVVARALPPDAGAEAVMLAGPAAGRDPARAAALAERALRGPIPPGEARSGAVVLQGATRARWVALEVRGGGGVLRVMGRLTP